jgi:hypothetical protein
MTKYPLFTAIIATLLLMNGAIADPAVRAESNEVTSTPQTQTETETATQGVPAGEENSENVSVSTPTQNTPEPVKEETSALPGTSVTPTDAAKTQPMAPSSHSETTPQAAVQQTIPQAAAAESTASELSAKTATPLAAIEEGKTDEATEKEHPFSSYQVYPWSQSGYDYWDRWDQRRQYLRERNDARREAMRQRSEWIRQMIDNRFYRTSPWLGAMRDAMDQRQMWHEINTDAWRRWVNPWGAAMRDWSQARQHYFDRIYDERMRNFDQMTGGLPWGPYPYW